MKFFTFLFLFCMAGADLAPEEFQGQLFSIRLTPKAKSLEVFVVGKPVAGIETAKSGVDLYYLWKGEFKRIPLSQIPTSVEVPHRDVEKIELKIKASGQSEVFDLKKKP